MVLLRALSAGVAVSVAASWTPPLVQGNLGATSSVADFTPFEQVIFSRWCRKFKSGSGIGEYSYFPGYPTSVYGSADMLMSLFVVGQLGNLTEAEKDSWAATINSFQDPPSGLYLAQAFEPHYGPAVLHAHDHEHTTAFALAALTLIGRSPAHPLTLMLELQANQSDWESWLANTALACTDSDGKPRRCPSWDHRSAGIIASLAMTNQLQPDFRSFFFGWLDAHADNATGYACADYIPYHGPPQVGWMTCYAHISWQYVYEKRQWPHAEKMVDTGLLMQNRSSGWVCVNPGDQPNPRVGTKGRESPQCKTTCAPSQPCTPTGCCGSASAVHPSCHQLDGLWTVARSRCARQPNPCRDGCSCLANVEPAELVLALSSSSLALICSPIGTIVFVLGPCPPT